MHSKHMMDHPGHYSVRNRVIRIVGMVVGGTIFIVVFAAIFGYMVQMLWNWLMPSLFAIREITYSEAFGLTILGRLLFGGFGGRGGQGRHHGHGRWKNRRHDWSEYKGWRYYDVWWNEEGRDAFKEYVEKKQGSAKEEEPKAAPKTARKATPKNINKSRKKT